MDRQALIAEIKRIRAEAQAKEQVLVDEYMERYESRSAFWKHVERSTIEVETWPAWKRGGL